MLVLTRKSGEKILFPDARIAVEVLAIKAGAVRLGIDAPPEVVVLREELQTLARAARAGAAEQPGPAADAALREFRHAMRNRLNAVVLGLAVLRRQQELGMIQDTEATLDRIDREMEALCRQLEAPTRLAAAAPVRTARARKALLVEDDLNECELLAGYLRLAGLEVDTAADGAEALDRLRTWGRPDVLLCDMVLPRCDGPTVVRTIRGDPTYSGLKIFGVTGQAPEGLGLESGPAGVDRWFLKPLNPCALLAELDRELAGVSGGDGATRAG